MYPYLRILYEPKINPIVSPTPPPINAPILEREQNYSRKNRRDAYGMKGLLYCADTLVSDIDHNLGMYLHFCQTEGPCCCGGGGAMIEDKQQEAAGLT